MKLGLGLQEDVVKIGVIGMGVMGKNHFRVLGGMPGVEVGAVCDSVVEGDFGVPLYRDVDTMFAKTKLDAVVVAVPTPLHKEFALKCIKHKMPMLLEKPVASNTQEADIILDAAEKLGVKVAVGHIERYNPVVETLKKEIVDKEIYSINITRVGPFPPRIGDVGILTDLSVHDIDLARFITGREFDDMRIFKSRKIVNHSEDNAEICFRLQDDIVGNITTNWLTPFKRRKIEVACKEAYYEADLMSQELMEYSGYERNNSYVSRWCFVQKGEPLRRELEAFVTFLKSGDQGHLAGIKDSMKTLEILENHAQESE